MIRQPLLLAFALLMSITMIAPSLADDKAKDGKKAAAKKDAAKKEDGKKEDAKKDDGKKEAKKTREVKMRDLVLNVPESWKQKKPSSRLRLGHFDIPAAGKDKEVGELGIFNFGGGGGGVRANAERWIGQFEAQGRKVKLKHSKSKSGEYVIVDVSGTYNKPVGPPIRRQTERMPNARMLGVILALTVGDERKGTYFLKLTGPKDTIAAAASDLRASFGATEKGEEEFDLEVREK